ncbi:hypothetical protein EMGBS15_11240 [Filimonas sp.]|nr:hypothetical protein EMGBS15_11240 [Filimonas sp.]
MIPLLQLAYFNPVVKEWTPEKQVEELRQREICDFCLYVITPKMEGFYSIAEAIDDSNKRPEKTIFCFLPTDETDTFTSVQITSLEAVCKMIKKNHAKVCHSLQEIADYLNDAV